MESWDVLLREKDRKVGVEQKTLDEREVTIRTSEDRLRQRDNDQDARALELRGLGEHISDQQEVYSRNIADLKAREAVNQSVTKKLDAQEQEYLTKELDYTAWEKVAI